MSDATLYNIAVDEMNALDDLLVLDSGEVTEESEELIEYVQTLLSNKTDSCVGYIKKQEDLIDIAKKRKKEIDDFIKSKQNKVDNFKNYILYCLKASKLNNINGEKSSIKIRKPSKIVNILDETLIPDEFITEEVIKKIDKNEIKKALKDGEVILGASLEDGKESLTIKMM